VITANQTLCVHRCIWTEIGGIARPAWDRINSQPKGGRSYSRDEHKDGNSTMRQAPQNFLRQAAKSIVVNGNVKQRD